SPTAMASGSSARSFEMGLLIAVALLGQEDLSDLKRAGLVAPPGAGKAIVLGVGRTAGCGAKVPELVRQALQARPEPAWRMKLAAGMFRKLPGGQPPRRTHAGFYVEVREAVPWEDLLIVTAGVCLAIRFDDGHPPTYGGYPDREAWVLWGDGKQAIL